MDLMILDTNLEAIAIIDAYESFIWTERYNECGDFELYTPISDGIFDMIKQDYYVQNRDSEHVMIIEKLLINSDAENGNHLTVTGRSLESILNRRIIWGLTILSGNLQDGVKKLIDECIINPSNSARKIDNFIFEYSDDTTITELNIKAQYTGDNLYDVIYTICSEHNIGFKITLNDNKQFVFKLYAGTDRSYEQTTNPYVVFSPNFDNLISSNYIESKSASKNVVLVGGEGEGSLRKYTSVGSASGLERKEFFADARDISSDLGDAGYLSAEEYNTLLQQRGKEKLAENAELTSFEGQIETTLMFKYGEDFFNGDIIQIADGYGHEARARIIEIVISDNEEGSSVYPTFKLI